MPWKKERKKERKKEDKIVLIPKFSIILLTFWIFFKDSFLVSLFNGISTFVGYLMLETSL